MFLSFSKLLRKKMLMCEKRKNLKYDMEYLNDVLERYVKILTQFSIHRKKVSKRYICVNSILYIFHKLKHFFLVFFVQIFFE